MVYILLLETSGLGRGKNKENKDQIQKEISKIIGNQVTVPYKDKIHSGYNLGIFLETLSRFTGWTGIARGLPPVPEKLDCQFLTGLFHVPPSNKYKVRILTRLLSARSASIFCWFNSSGRSISASSNFPRKSPLHPPWVPYNATRMCTNYYFFQIFINIQQEAQLS